MKLKPTIAAIFNPTTGEYYEPQKGMTMQEANKIASDMLTRNPAAQSDRSDRSDRARPLGLSNDELSDTGERGQDFCIERYGGGAKTNYSKTNYNGLYIAVGVLLIVLLLNK